MSKSITSHVTKVEEENTGGNCMVTFVHLADGRVLGINDESVVLYRDMDDWRDCEGEDRPYIDLCDDKQFGSFRFAWRTDAASGEIYATNADAAMRKLITQDEWAEDDDRHVKDGAWLTIFDADGVPVLRRGTMP